MTISYQFDSPDADVIFLTTDGDRLTEFYVHKCILAAASPFFYDMFSLPQSDNDTCSKSTKLPVIPVSDTARDVDTVLRCIYPLPPPIIDSLDELSTVLGVALKYDVEIATNTLRRLLVAPHHLKASPVRVYAIACRYELDEEAQLAAQHTLGINILDAPPCAELRYIPASAYHALLSLHRRRARAALDLLGAVPGLHLQCTDCNSSAYTVHRTPRWWGEFVRAAREEFALRPTTAVVFGMEFMFRAARASGCVRCPESLLNSWEVLEGLRAAIDALPATVGDE